MSITYNQLGPGYDDASLGYNGEEVASVTGTGAATITDPNRLSAETDESYTATVTVE